jgi:hypothetical protein
MNIAIGIAAQPGQRLKNAELKPPCCAMSERRWDAPRFAPLGKRLTLVIPNVGGDVIRSY